MVDLNPTRYTELSTIFLDAIAGIPNPQAHPRNTGITVINHLFSIGWDRQKVIDHLPYLQRFMDEVMAEHLFGFGEEPNTSLRRDVRRRKGKRRHPDLFEDLQQDGDQRDRAWIDELIANSKLYDNAERLKGLLDFTIKLRKFSPFNAMLLHVQRPGLSYAARTDDWWRFHRRRPRETARPLLILRPFGPVDFVYDVLDLEGGAPPLVQTFPTLGAVPSRFIADCTNRLARVSIELVFEEYGDRRAGFASRLTDHRDPKRLQTFRIGVNRNHPPTVQAVTLFHELAHVYLGHCGADRKRDIEFHRPSLLSVREVEAETVAYLIGKRSGLSPRSENYLSNYQDGFEHLDIYHILKTANTIETLLGLPFEDLLVFD